MSLDVLKYLDMTEVRPYFHINGKDKYTTRIGGLFTFAGIIVLCLTIYAFGKNFFERTNPSMIQQQIYPTKYQNYTMGVNESNFTFAVRFEDYDAKVVNRSDVLYIDFYYYHYEIRDGVWFMVEKKQLDYEYCKRSQFENQDLYDALDLRTAFCPKIDDLVMGGFWDETYIKFLRIFAVPCKVGSVNNKGEKCTGDDKELKHIMGNRLYVSSFYQEYFVNSKIYDNPMNLVYSNHFWKVDPNILKSYSYFFRQGEINTDYGWILKSEDSVKKYTLDTQSMDIITKSYLPVEQQTNIGEVYVYFAKKQEQFIRTYEKIQNLSANVGGIIKIFYMFLFLVQKFFTNKIMNYEILTYFDETYHPPKPQKMINNLVREYDSVNVTKNHLQPIKRSTMNLSFERMNTESNPKKKNDNTSRLLKYLCKEACMNKFYRNEFKNIEMKVTELLELKNYFKDKFELNAMKIAALDEFQILSLSYMNPECFLNKLSEQDKKKRFIEILNEKRNHLDTLSEKEKIIISLLKVNF